MLTKYEGFELFKHITFCSNHTLSVLKDTFQLVPLLMIFEGRTVVMKV